MSARNVQQEQTRDLRCYREGGCSIGNHPLDLQKVAFGILDKLDWLDDPCSLNIESGKAQGKLVAVHWLVKDTQS